MTAPKQLRVAVHHSRALVREGLVAALGRHPAVSAVASVDLRDADGRAALRDADALVVELLPSADAPWRDLADLGLPSGLRVVGVHTGVSLDDARRAMELGVRALVPDGAGLAGVVEALLPTGWAATAVGVAPSSVPKLDPSELAVLRALSLGTTSRRGAAALGLTPSQFDDAKQRAFVKLGVGHQAHAVASALRHGLLDEQVHDGSSISGRT